MLYGAIVGSLLPTIGERAYQLAIGSLLILLLIGLAIVRRIPDLPAERRPPGPDAELAVPLQPAIVPPAETPR